MATIIGGKRRRGYTAAERSGVWARLYELVLNLLGSTGIIIPIGDHNHESEDRTTVTAIGDEASIFTYSEAVTSFDRSPFFRGPVRIPVVDFNGTDEEADTPDATYWSRGDGSNDSPFSVGVWADVTDTSAIRSILGKWEVTSGAEKREWLFDVNGGDNLRLSIYDESANARHRHASDAKITMGEIRFFVGTYDGVGGHSAGDNIVLYDNGVVMPSTATNNASYVAMENLAGLPTLAFNVTNSGPGDFFVGSLVGGPFAPFFTQKELTADEVRRLYHLGRIILDI